MKSTQKGEGRIMLEVEKMNLLEADVGKTYTVKEINTDDDEMTAFLFRLGCYSGEPVTVISKKKKGCVVAIKDGRYSFDKFLASAVMLNEEEDQIYH